MKKAENGNFVKVEYTGKFEDGETFDSNRNGHPLEVEVGTGGVIKGFDDALIGMAVDEEKTFTLSPEEAYGERNEELEQSFMRLNSLRGLTHRSVRLWPSGILKVARCRQK
ncbi:MAG: FKBP-type peptidyl-prolyl cis-trans isomerase [Deltaproteobacteria bacterium]|nr:FKBP-type peptidyl-prolyl cis-trans isomerase [Deltaproteobacteria bacterium]